MKYIKFFFEAEWLVFLFCGSITTALTYFIYVGLTLLINYTVAYSIAFFIGIIVSYILNSKFTFKEKLRFDKLMQYPIVYLVQYLVGLSFLYFLVQIFGINKLWAPLLIIIFTLPISFILSRFIIKKDKYV